MFILLVHSQTRQPTLLKYDVGTLYSNVSFFMVNSIIIKLLFSLLHIEFWCKNCDSECV